MDLLTKRPKGTRDMLPGEAYKWHTVERVAQETAERFGFREMRTPVFEHTELFLRSVGATTDVVQKEMYTFQDKGDRSITLRPEGTAGAVRSALENGLLNEALPLKIFYQTSCYRYENVQAGRLREFHQFGAEMFGSPSPRADAEAIALAHQILKRLGIDGVELHINSIGCPSCRAEYHKALREYFGQAKDRLCGTCLERLEKNPMRLLDCKSPVCSQIAQGAPSILDYLCGECREHFETLQRYLHDLGIAYSVDPKIVRGLDYYTRTVFEFLSGDLGAQSAVCAGGRYDGLVEELGGPSTAALGFAMGMERLLMIMEKQESPFFPAKSCDLYLASLGEDTAAMCVKLADRLRDEGYWAEYDLMGRGLRAQMKYADKIGADFTMVLGDDEVKKGSAPVKNMETGQQTELSLGDCFVDHFSNLVVSAMLDGTLEEPGPDA